MVTEMKKAFDGLISTLDTAEERIFEPEYISLEISKTKKTQRMKPEKNGISKDCRTTAKKCNICIMGIRRRKNETEKKL